MLLYCILDVYLSFLFVCTESLTRVSDPTSRRFIRWLLFQTFIYYFSWVSPYYVFEYNPYKPIFMDYNFYFKDLRNIKQNLIKIDQHISNLSCYISLNKVPKGLKIKVTPQTPGIKTNNFYRRWDRILFECSTRLLKLLLDDVSYQRKGLEIFFRICLKPVKNNSRQMILQTYAVV
jgi:hypothetical protein